MFWERARQPEQSVCYGRKFSAFLDVDSRGWTQSSPATSPHMSTKHKPEHPALEDGPKLLKTSGDAVYIFGWILPTIFMLQITVTCTCETESFALPLCRIRETTAKVKTKATPCLACRRHGAQTSQNAAKMQQCIVAFYPKSIRPSVLNPRMLRRGILALEQTYAIGVYSTFGFGASRGELLLKSTRNLRP